MDICKKIIELEVELKANMRTVCNDDALVNDSYQDAYIKFHNYGKKRKKFYGTHASIKSLLILSCRNILIDKLRQIKKEASYPIEHAYSFVDYSMPDDDLIQAEQSLDDPFINKKLNDAFNNMTHMTHMTYQLRKKGFSFKDIAYLTDSSRNTSLARFRYAKIKIENEFKLK